MKPQPDAPWAEAVSTVPYPMSLEDYLKWPGEDWDDAKLCELVKGRVVRNPFGGGYGGVIQARLGAALHWYGEAHSHCALIGAHCILNLRDEALETCVRASLLLVQNERLPPREDTAAWNRPPELAPDLVVEIEREGQSREALAEKARLWLVAGVRLIWVIWPEEEAVDVWMPSQPGPLRTLRAGDQLDGMEVVPGFSYPIADLFQ